MTTGEGRPAPAPPVKAFGRAWGIGSGLGRTMAFASGMTVAATVASALTGLAVARFLGPSVRGEYAAVTAWYGMALIAAELGQPAAICYYVAHDPARARHYVATSRNLMLLSGAVVALGGFFLAPALAGGKPSVIFGYRLVFGVCPIVYAGGSYLFALQARSIRQWVTIRLAQPATFLAAVAVLEAAGQLSLRSAVAALVGSSVLGAVVAAGVCRRWDLVGGHSRRSLRRKLVRYGVSQVVATTPTTINVSLDQVVLSQTVASADLGRYAIAVSLTAVAWPLVTPIGSVLFPHIAAARRHGDADAGLQVRAVLLSAGLAAVLMAAVSAAAPWLVPLVLGSGYKAAVPLVWIMAPAGVFLVTNQVIGDLLRGRNQTLAVAVAQGGGAVVTVALLGALIPPIGVTGAAVATSVSYAVSLVILLHAFRSRLQTTGAQTIIAAAPWPEPGTIVYVLMSL